MYCRLGRKPVILGCHVLAVVSRVCSAVAPTYVLFVLCRVLSIAFCFGFYTAGFILGKVVFGASAPNGDFKNKMSLPNLPIGPILCHRTTSVMCCKLTETLGLKYMFTYQLIPLVQFVKSTYQIIYWCEMGMQVGLFWPSCLPELARLWGFGVVLW